MEEKQFEKVERWFTTLNERIGELQAEVRAEIGDVRESMNGLATRKMVENRFDMLAESMKNLLERMMKVEKRVGSQDAEIIVLRLALKKLELDIETLRERVH